MCLDMPVVSRSMKVYYSSVCRGVIKIPGMRSFLLDEIESNGIEIQFHFRNLFYRLHFNAVNPY